MPAKRKESAAQGGSVTTRNMRDNLKSIVTAELERLPESLQGMDDERRVSLLLKLLPYVLPKVESVSPTYGEPFTLDDDVSFPRTVDVHIVNSPRN